MRSFLTDSADVVGRVAVAYEPASSDQAWAETLADAMTPLMRASRGVGVNVIEYAPDLSTAAYAASTVPAGEHWPWATAPEAGLSTVGVEWFRRSYFEEGPVVIQHELAQRLSHGSAARMREFRAAMGGGDALGILAHPVPGVVVTLYAVHHGELHASRRERTVLKRAALHLEAAFRLRRCPSVLVCELGADGRLLGEKPQVGRISTLSRRARDLARAHAASRESADALALWPALLDGRLTVVRRGTGSRARFLFLENPPAQRATRTLTAEEVQALALAARGLSNKLVAYGLGISPAAACRRLDLAAAKLGLMTRAELVRVAAILTRDPRAQASDAVLTRAEQDVLALVQNGFSNAQIAKLRSRSVRTVANQVASLLEKTGRTSRRGLTAL